MNSIHTSHDERSRLYYIYNIFAGEYRAGKRLKLLMKTDYNPYYTYIPTALPTLSRGRFAMAKVRIIILFLLIHPLNRIPTTYFHCDFFCRGINVIYYGGTIHYFRTGDISRMTFCKGLTTNYH